MSSLSSMKDGEFAWSGLGSEEMEGGGRPEIASYTGSTDCSFCGEGRGTSYSTKLEGEREWSEVVDP